MEMPVDRQAFDLVEDRGVGGVQFVGAEHPARADHVDRRLRVQHGADLHRGGVRAQHQFRESVRRRRRRCPAWLRAGWSLREVERVEVEPLGLELGALGDLPAHRDEDVLDALGTAW